MTGAAQGGGELLDVVGITKSRPSSAARARAARPASRPRGARATFEIGDLARPADQRRDVIDDLIDQGDRPDQVHRRSMVGPSRLLLPQLSGTMARPWRHASRRFAVPSRASGSHCLLNKKRSIVLLAVGTRLLLNRVCVATTMKRSPSECDSPSIALAVPASPPAARPGFWAGAIDLVGQQQIGENRPARQSEARGLELNKWRR